MRRRKTGFEGFGWFGGGPRMPEITFSPDVDLCLPKYGPGVASGFRAAVPAHPWGRMSCGIKSVEDARVGDTITLAAAARKGTVKSLPGYAEAVPMVYCGLFPTEAAGQAGPYPGWRRRCPKVPRCLPRGQRQRRGSHVTPERGQHGPDLKALWMVFHGDPVQCRRGYTGK